MNAAVYGAIDATTPRVSGVELGRGVEMRWRLRDTPSGLTAGTLLESVLKSRRVTDADRAARFLAPSLSHLHNPELLPDCEKAAHRILHALRAGEAVVIYGDYDVDGVTATAVLYHTLVHLGKHLTGVEPNLKTYVPHRLEEGYGLNLKAIQTLAAEGARLIITVDCGVTAVGPAAAARAAGVDLIITDHHNPPQREEDLPEAYAVVHPRRPGSRYPRSELSGAGVAYKLAWQLCVMAQGARVNADTRALLVDLLAFAALGTIADVVPLGGEGGEGDENRLIAHFGLTRVRTSRFTGLRALCRAARLDSDKVSEWDVGFKLAPRLNACGRMNHAKEAVELFTTASPERAAAIAEELETANTQRRAVEAAIVRQADELVRAKGMDGRDRRAIVLAHPDWHAGVVGICCSRLVERFCRPVILMQVAEHGAVVGTAGGLQAHGSGRSIEGYSLHAGLEACAAHLVKFGGHDMAAGLRLEMSNLEAFTEAFTAHANNAISDEMLTRVVDVDAVLETAGGQTRQPRFDLAGVKAFDILKPFGRGNPAVRLLFKGARVGSVRSFGKSGNHAEIALDLAALGPGHWVSTIAWGAYERLTGDGPHRLQRGTLIDAVIEPRIETYGGERAGATMVDHRAVG